LKKTTKKTVKVKNCLYKTDIGIYGIGDNYEKSIFNCDGGLPFIRNDLFLQSE